MKILSGLFLVAVLLGTAFSQHRGGNYRGPGYQHGNRYGNRHGSRYGGNYGPGYRQGSGYQHGSNYGCKYI